MQANATYSSILHLFRRYSLQTIFNAQGLNIEVYFRQKGGPYRNDIFKLYLGMYVWP